MTQFVARYRITAVRREPAIDGSHTHVTGILADGEFFTLRQVLRSIILHNQWLVETETGLWALGVLRGCRHCVDMEPHVATDAADPTLAALHALPDC